MSRRRKIARRLGPRFGTTTQLVQAVWGLQTGKKHCINLTLAEDFPGAMKMDAPTIIPAGSTSRVEVSDGWFSVNVNYALRDD